MSSTRYVRWQGLAMTQLTVAIALTNGLSVVGLGAGFSLLKDEKCALIGCCKCAFILSQIFLLLAALLSWCAVITRALDFRLTARKVLKDEKPDYEKPLIIFGFDKDGYGRVTWWLFGLSCVSLSVGAVLLVLSIVDRVTLT